MAAVPRLDKKMFLLFVVQYACFPGLWIPDVLATNRN